ncbi:MAG: hypothetical protein CM15mP65_01310 [Crocinitomicaceae bacterium]|nr:MAG: hypothetical protein CM15mP65_01310 [Crocinitomicaceae bacterium]
MNKSISRFNIRVYALIIFKNNILLSRELIQNKLIYKFPGGGVELGEGFVDALQREAKEEMGQHLNHITHFYTTDFFQRSSFDSSEQLISVYFKASLSQHLNNRLKIPVKDQPVFEWKTLVDLNEEDLHFPIDKKVLNMIKLQ